MWEKAVSNLFLFIPRIFAAPFVQRQNSLYYVEIFFYIPYQFSLPFDELLRTTRASRTIISDIEDR